MSRLDIGWTLLMLVTAAKCDDGNGTSTVAPAHATPRLPQPAAGSFTPSYFLGEVLAEPYVPDRFLERNASSRKEKVAPQQQTKRGGGFFPAPPPVQEEPEEDAKDSTRPVTFDEDPWQPPTPPRAKHPHPYPFDFGPHPDQADGDLVLPTPLYPDFRHKDPPHHYKVYQHRGVSSPLKGVLGAVAALLPVGLLVASLYPNVLHVNANPAPPPPPPPHLK